MVDLQREHALASSGIVVEGRDIGSVVLPQADIKVFLTADPGVRALAANRPDEAREVELAGRDDDAGVGDPVHPPEPSRARARRKAFGRTSIGGAPERVGRSSQTARFGARLTL